MDAVARRAGEIAAVVRAALPRRVRAAIVAGEARLADFLRLHRGELQDVSLGVVVDVRLAGAVAALAALAGGRRARILRLAVLAGVDARFLIGVAADAGIGPGITSLRSARRLDGRRLRGSLRRWGSGLRRR